MKALESFVEAMLEAKFGEPADGAAGLRLSTDLSREVEIVRKAAIKSGVRIVLYRSET